MEKLDLLQKQLNNLDLIEQTIKNNNKLQKQDDSQSLNSLIKLDIIQKEKLESKIKIIKKFTDKMDSIIENKPEPNTLKPELVEYLGYTGF